MANISILPTDRNTAVTGFDTGPGNALMDDWIRQNKNTAMDKDGVWASKGAYNQKLLLQMLSDDYFRQSPPKSTGIEYFNLDWLSSFNYSLRPENVQATLLALTTETITQAIKHYAPATKEVLVCGGGVHNKALMLAMKNKLPDCSVASTRNYGLDPDCIEAVTFAWLAKQRLEEIPSNLPAVTGATKQVVLGAIYDVKSKE
jgi:anhydro-N-acetylmuramic acid kinase